MINRPVDTLSTYHLSIVTTKTTAIQQPTRYAIRQVLDQELRKDKILQASLSRQARGNGVMNSSHAEFDTPSLIDKENVQPIANTNVPLRAVKVKRDFFGRPVHNASFMSLPTDGPLDGTKIDASSIAKSTAFKGKVKVKAKGTNGDDDEADGHGRIWVSFHEGFSNAVRKPISLGDLLDGF